MSECKMSKPKVFRLAAKSSTLIPVWQIRVKSGTTKSLRLAKHIQGFRMPDDA